MKYLANNLSKQLIWLVGLAFILLFISLGIVLPRVIIPVAEENVYNYLNAPLHMLTEVEGNIVDKKVAYIYISDNIITTSSNLSEIITFEKIDSILDKINLGTNKFIYKHKTYYYSAIKENSIVKIAITNDDYINTTKTKILGAIFPIVLATCLVIGILLIGWSSIFVRKIEKIKNKVDNIDNPNYNHNINFLVDDELKSLLYAIEDMRLSLINQEQLRNQMYQNISHDFKTPLTVIKSYIEAVDDSVEDKDEALKVIAEQTSKLETKVHSLLYLNKLDYLKDIEKGQKNKINIREIIINEIEKFKYQRKDLNYIIDIDKKVLFYGTKENWEIVLDNLLSNFMRYADKTIKITAKSNKLVLYNDGDNIEEDLLHGIFIPFRKGIKGEFGLGLSIVKKTLSIMNYNIIIKNEKRGVSFIITRHN